MCDAHSFELYTSTVAQKEGVMFLSKSLAVVLVAFTLLLQGCATSSTGGAGVVRNYQNTEGKWVRCEKGDECDQSFWSEFNVKYAEVRAHGARMDEQGNILYPTTTQGEYQIKGEIPYRVAHPGDCLEETPGQKTTRFIIDGVSIFAPSVRVMQGAQVASGHIQQHNAKARTKECRELVERLRVGNAELHRTLVVKAERDAQLITQAQTPTGTSAPVVTQPAIDPVLANCAAVVQGKFPNAFPDSMGVQEIIDGLSRRCELAGRGWEYNVLPDGSCDCVGAR